MKKCKEIAGVASNSQTFAELGGVKGNFGELGARWSGWELGNIRRASGNGKKTSESGVFYSKKV